jgi:hypothetical protein
VELTLPQDHRRRDERPGQSAASDLINPRQRSASLRDPSVVERVVGAALEAAPSCSAGLQYAALVQVAFLTRAFLPTFSRM